MFHTTKILQISFAKCSICGNLFHLSHHYRRFDNSVFKKDFVEYNVIKIDYGSYGIPLTKKVIILGHKLNVYAYSDVAMCNKCGNPAVRSTGVNRYFMGGLNLICENIKSIFKIKKPYYQIALLERGSYL